MRMGRVNISLPDEIIRRAKDAGLNISALSRDAIVAELEKRAKIAALDRYLDELDAELGPISEEEQARANAWVERMLNPNDEERRTA
jgi:post-segregation antitoxin (ccd killing protein)